MDDKQPMQAAGGGGREGALDGVENPNGSRGDAGGGGGQSEGGAYPNPQSGKKGDENGFFGHGGQSHIDYSGTGDKDDPDGNPNAVAGGD